MLSDPRAMLLHGALMFLPEGLETEGMDANRFYDGKKTRNPFSMKKIYLIRKKK
ncbi:hypothetical protein BDZ91DRAFT_726768 [Kalaharituber pfeilii]|nr:hypothetical protein BDZ91DRAFT_726768 [Kalaharituber pfeilii]